MDEKIIPAEVNPTTEQFPPETNRVAEPDADDIEFETYDRERPKGKGEYIVTLRVAASRLKTIEKDAEAAFGEMLLSVEKDNPATSRSALLAEAEEEVDKARGMVEDLRDGLQNWRDNLPENFQDGAKATELDDAIEALGELAEQLDSQNFNFAIDMPGMY